MKTKEKAVYRFLIVLFHAVGVAGFLIPFLVPVFLKIVPWHLLLMLFLLISASGDKSKNFWVFIIITFISGFVIEFLGVYTGQIFGKYSYGNTLGMQFSGVPLLIGVNWVILIYSTGVSLRKLQVRSASVKSLLGAVILVLLDILIEPVAIKFDYWRWSELDVPFQNYMAWFIVSFLLLRLFYAIDFKKRNPAAQIMLICQFSFFIALNLWAF